MRFELKFVINSEDLSSITNTINFNFFNISKLYPDRKINSIYYDDCNFSCYFNHINGNSRRFKSRIRWYNNDTSKLTLEKKIKTGITNYKVKQSLHKNFFNESLEKNFSKFDFLPYPTLSNSYLRSYYVIKGFEKIRVTFDTNIQSWHPSRKTKYLFNKTIIEFKTHIDEKRNLKEVIRRMPMKYTKNSKYISGINRVYY